MGPLVGDLIEVSEWLDLLQADRRWLVPHLRLPWHFGILWAWQGLFLLSSQLSIILVVKIGTDPLEIKNTLGVYLRVFGCKWQLVRRQLMPLDSFIRLKE